MSVLAIVPPADLQCGDSIVMNHEVWTLIVKDGPDRIGTYDLLVKNKDGIHKAVIVTEPVTIMV
jgi:hypothetical protein